MKFTKNLKIALKSLLSLKCGEVDTDKGVIYWDGEEDLKAGDDVFTKDGEDFVAAADGEYVTPDNKTIVVAEGKVSEIKDAEAEVATEENIEESTAKAQFTAQVVKMSESYDEKYRKIAAALLEENENAYISEAGDDYAIKVVWNEETGEETYLRYSISWDEEGNVVVGDFEEVKRAFVPVNENVAMSEETPAPVDEPATEEGADAEARIAALEESNAKIIESFNHILAVIEEINARIAEVEGKLANVEAPASNPVEQTPVEEQQHSGQKYTRISYLRK